MFNTCVNIVQDIDSKNLCKDLDQILINNGIGIYLRIKQLVEMV